MRGLFSCTATTPLQPVHLGELVERVVEELIDYAGEYPSRDAALARTKAEEMQFWYRRSLEA